MGTDDRTIIKPRPGKRGAPSKPAASDQTIIKPRPRPGGSAAKPSANNNDSTVVKPRKSRPQNANVVLTPQKTDAQLKQSPLIDAASGLLSLSPQLRQLEGRVDVPGLHQQIKQLILDFQQSLKPIIDDSEIRRNASYILCSLIDETVLNTPWGENSAWSQKPVLSIFHKETYGGEKVYTILDDAMSEPGTYYELIELAYLSLSLGFMGKLRIDPQGITKVEHIRTQAYDVLNRSRERYQKELSVNTAPATGLKHKLHSFLPVWLFIATLTLIAFSVYNYWLIDLNKRSDHTGQLLAELIPLQQEPKLPDNRVRPEVLALRKLLAPEIERNILSVDDYRTRTSVVLHAEELFSSGSTNINEAYQPVLDKIAKALEAIPGRIIVSGHTDNIAIRTPRFPSNWHLSLARASAVVKYMDNVGELTGRMLPEGRGENEPVADNETTEGRAKNRRVVIDMFYENQPQLLPQTDR